MMAKLGIGLDLIATVVGHETEGAKQTRVLVKHYIHDDFINRKAHALAAWDRRLRAILAGEAEGGQVDGGDRIGHAALACCDRRRTHFFRRGHGLDPGNVRAAFA